MSGCGFGPGLRAGGHRALRRRIGGNEAHLDVSRFGRRARQARDKGRDLAGRQLLLGKREGPVIKFRPRIVEQGDAQARYLAARAAHIGDVARDGENRQPLFRLAFVTDIAKFEAAQIDRLARHRIEFRGRGPERRDLMAKGISGAKRSGDEKNKQNPARRGERLAPAHGGGAAYLGAKPVADIGGAADRARNGEADASPADVAVSANTISSSSSKAGGGCTSSPTAFAGEGFSPNIFLRGVVPGTGNAAGGAGERPSDGAWCQL